MKNIFWFYSIACFLSWTIALPLVLPYFTGRAINTLPYHHALVGLGPMLAAFIMKSATEGKKGVQALLKSMIQVRSIMMLLIALSGPFILLFLAAFIDHWVNKNSFEFSAMGRTKEFPQFSPLVYFFYNLIFFGYGEETGWKGYMLPKLQQKFDALSASLVFVLFWAVWHLPLFFYRPGYVSMDLGGIAGWFFSLATGSVLLTWLFNSSRGSILVCAVFHAAIDIAFVSDFTSLSVTMLLGMLITFWGFLTIAVFKQRNLSHKPKVTEC